MKIKILLPVCALLLALALACPLSGCSRELPREMLGSTAVIFPTLSSDGGFPAELSEGIGNAARNAGVRYVCTEGVSAGDAAKTLTDLAEENYDIIIAHGENYGEALRAVAGKFPLSHFVYSNGKQTYELENVTAVSVDYYAVGYMGGVICALADQRGRVALLTDVMGVNRTLMEQGFYAGAKFASPEIVPVSLAAPEAESRDGAYAAAGKLIAEGADVLFVCLDPDAAEGAVSAAAENGARIVGAERDYAAEYVPASSVAGSVIVDWERLGRLEAVGEYTDGSTHLAGIAEDVIDVKLNVSFGYEGLELLDLAENACK